MQNLKLLSLIVFFVLACLTLYFYLDFNFKPPQVFINFRASIFSDSGYVGNFFSELKHIRNLTKENMGLREENTLLLSQLAKQASLEEENQYLREALNLSGRKNLKIIDAGVFNFQLNPDGNNFLVNKGSNDGLKSGDMIISSSGVLVGVIIEVFSNYSEAELPSNLGFKVTGAVLNKDIYGMAEGVLNNEMRFQFISQNDNIMEGDIVITAGSDIFPAGFIIGAVSQISSNESNLFKDILIKTAASDVNLRQVLVISR